MDILIYSTDRDIQKVTQFLNWWTFFNTEAKLYSKVLAAEKLFWTTGGWLRISYPA